MVCLSELNTTCIPDYKMLAIIQTTDLTGLQADGILGLAPSS